MPTRRTKCVCDCPWEVTWITDDGKEFTDEVEARAHEDTLRYERRVANRRERGVIAQREGHEPFETFDDVLEHLLGVHGGETITIRRMTTEEAESLPHPNGAGQGEQA